MLDSITDGLQYDDSFNQPTMAEIVEAHQEWCNTVDKLLDGQTLKGNDGKLYKLSDMAHEESEELGAFVDEGQDVVWMHKNGLLTAGQSQEVISKAKWLASVVVG